MKYAARTKVPVDKTQVEFKRTLTGNDLALASFACAHAINWCKAQGRSKYWKAEVEKYSELSRTLQRLGQEAYPFTSDPEGGILDFGDEEIMRLDSRVVEATTQRLRRAGAVVTHTPPTPTPGVDEANARLIAAAPDLYAALHDAREILRGNAMTKSALTVALAAANAALRKAEGRTP